MQTSLKKAILQAATLTGRALGVLDGKYLAKDVDPPLHTSHDKWQQFLLDLINERGLSVLEVGSREVTGKSFFRDRISNYTGFDIHAGANVDVIGDAHRLSTFFPEKKFDLVLSSSCFEHFAAPWVVAKEISKVLRVGGYAFIETHFAFSSHERPWHFFHFTDLGLQALFPRELGFECIESGMSSPVVGRFSRFAAKSLRGKPIIGMYCHSEYFGRKTRVAEDFSLDDIDIAGIVGQTTYPLGPDR